MAVSETYSLLKDGVASAQSGNKARARLILRQVVTLETDNEIAWLWLANVASDATESLTCLRTVLKLNPTNQHAHASLTNTLLRAGIEAAQGKQAVVARNHFAEVLQIDPRNEHALLWSAGVATSSNDAISYLQKLLQINPNHERAKQGLAQYTKQANGWKCPFCESAAPQVHDRCPSCQAIVTLKNPSAFDAPTGAHELILARAVARLNIQAANDPGGTASFHLGLAYLNLGQPAEAIKILNSAATQPQADATWRQQTQALAAHWRSASQPVANQPKPLIMAVDDSATVRKLVMVALQGAGYDVVSLADGRQVDDALAKHGVPQLFILDINMPVMDGYQVCQHLREIERTKHVPIVFLTGKDGFFNKLRGKWAGAAEYLTKPFQPQALIEVVNTIVPLHAE
jgi:twitching motility two-component system response regulator PilG